MRRLFGIICFLLLIAGSLNAAEKIEIDRISVKDLQSIYDFYDYNGEKSYLMIPSYRYPPIFLRHFPIDFNSLSNETERNALFIKILAQLAIRTNDEILDKRLNILALADSSENGKKLTPKQMAFIEEKAAKYDVFTHHKGHLRYSYMLDELQHKIHVIPPSILITAAALETNWGTSRIVKEGNSLYKILNWYSDEGLKPLGEKEDDTYRIKTYPDILSSMQEFALKLNSELKYANFRGFRHQILGRRTPLLGSNLAPYLVWNSPLKNYAGLFDYTLAYYELNIIDKSILDSKIISKDLPKNLKDKTM